jgi:hypothetical protein
MGRAPLEGDQFTAIFEPETPCVATLAGVVGKANVVADTAVDIAELSLAVSNA